MTLNSQTLEFEIREYRLAGNQGGRKWPQVLKNGWPLLFPF